MRYFDVDIHARKVLLLDFVEANDGAFVNISNSIMPSNEVFEQVEIFFFAAFRKNTFISPKWLYPSQLIDINYRSISYMGITESQRRSLFHFFIRKTHSIPNLPSREFEIVEEFFRVIYTKNPKIVKKLAHV